jgi:hypothetical protein
MRAAPRGQVSTVRAAAVDPFDAHQSNPIARAIHVADVGDVSRLHLPTVET